METESARRLWALVRYLPQDAALWRAHEVDPPPKVERDPSRMAAFFNKYLKGN